MFILQSFFHSQYQLSRNCLVSVKQRPVTGVYCPSVSFADLCFGEQLCRFFVSVLWFSVQDNSYLGYSEVSSYFFLFHELKTKRQQNMWNVTQVYSKFLVIFGPGKLLHVCHAWSYVLMFFQVREYKLMPCSHLCLFKSMRFRCHRKRIDRFASTLPFWCVLDRCPH